MRGQEGSREKNRSIFSSSFLEEPNIKARCTITQKLARVFYSRLIEQTGDIMLTYYQSLRTNTYRNLWQSVGRLDILIVIRRPTCAFAFSSFSSCA